MMQELTPKLLQFIETGTPKQAKQAVRCLHRNVLPENHEIFETILKVHYHRYIFFVVDVQ